MIDILYVLDGSNYIYRAYYAGKDGMSNDKGFPTNALYVFAKMVRKFLQDTNPAYMITVFDTPHQNFRHDLFPAYKVNRAGPPPETLVRQMPLFRTIMNLYGVKVVDAVGVEADDVIGALALQFKQQVLVVILGADKDLMQLIDSRVVMLDTMRGKRFGIHDVVKKFGVKPNRVVDVLGLAGDHGDGVPGVPGIGEKTATALVNEFGTVEGVLANIDKISGAKRKQMLETYADLARLSKVLVTLKTDMDLGLTLDDLRVGAVDTAALTLLYDELGFSSLMSGSARNNGGWRSRM